MSLPQYNNHLPYDINNENESLLQNIKKYLPIMIEQGKFYPEAYSLGKQLLEYFILDFSYIELKFQLEMKDRLFFIRLIYDIILIERLDSQTVKFWSDIVCRLAK